MADHAAKQILDAIKTKLTVPALASVPATKVHRARVKSLGDDQLPALLIYLGEGVNDLDQLSNLDTGELVETWEQSIRVTLVAKDSDSETGENLLLEIRKEVEVALYADTTLGIGVKDIVLKSVGEPEIDGDTNKKALKIEMDWAVLYRLQQGVPDAIIQ